jgi:hypothetical protein
MRLKQNFELIMKIHVNDLKMENASHIEPTPSKNQKTLKDGVIMLAKNAALETTAHGIPQLVGVDNKLLKILWLLAILGSMSGCGYLLNDAVSNYLEYKVITTIKKIGESPALFPVFYFL